MFEGWYGWLFMFICILYIFILQTSGSLWMLEKNLVNKQTNMREIFGQNIIATFFFVPKHF